jgi:hypothetical protein
MSWDVRGGTHLARQCHEVHSNRSSTVLRQSHFPSLHMLPRARTSCLWPASSCRGTSSPSPWSIRPFLRWRPVCPKGMVSTVFSIAHGCSVLYVRLHRGAVWCSCSAAGRWCEVLPVGRPRREHRAHVQVHIPQRAEHSSHLSTHCLRCSQHHCASLGRARTGAFCRFAGRPSPGLSAVPPALRFDALSIFA